MEIVLATQARPSFSAPAKRGCRGRISTIVLATQARPSYANANRKERFQSMIPSDLAGGGTGFHHDHAHYKKEAERRQAR